MQILGSKTAATAEELSALQAHFGVVPLEYLEMASEATEVEIRHTSGQYFRIWGPSGCIDMDEGYEIRRRIHDAFPIGDDGGGRVIFYQDGKRGLGLYHVGYGNLNADDAIWIAPSLADLMLKGVGVGSF